MPDILAYTNELQFKRPKTQNTSPYYGLSPETGQYQTRRAHQTSNERQTDRQTEQDRYKQQQTRTDGAKTTMEFRVSLKHMPKRPSSRDQAKAEQPESQNFFVIVRGTMRSRR